MDVREVYAWWFLGAVAVVLFGLSLYFYFNASGALAEGVRPWVGDAFLHRPEAELQRYRYLGLAGAVVTGGLALMVLAGGLARLRAARRFSP